MAEQDVAAATVLQFILSGAFIPLSRLPGWVRAPETRTPVEVTCHRAAG